MAKPAAHTADPTLQVLIVGGDRSLEDEFRAALAGTADAPAVVHFAESPRQALETARGRQPHFILIEIDRDAAAVAALSKSLHELVPAAAIAGAYKVDVLDHGRSASATLIELLRAHMSDFVRRPLATTELRAVLDRLTAAAPRTGPAERGRVVSFVSNKGGVGKSALAVNVACALALRHPDEILLVDTSLQIGTCAVMLDLKPTTSVVDAVRERDRLDTTLLRNLSLRHGSGLRLLAAPGDALEGADVDDEAIARVLNLARRSFRMVIVDTFPILDNVAMTILDLTDVAMIVMQGTTPAVAGAARLLPVLDSLGVPGSRQRLILNYNYKSFLGDLRPTDIANRLQRTIDYVVPYDKRVLTSMNTGVPQIIHATRWQKFKRTIDQIADDLDGIAAVGAEGQDDLRRQATREVTL